MFNIHEFVAVCCACIYSSVLDILNNQENLHHSGVVTWKLDSNTKKNIILYFASQIQHCHIFPTAQFSFWQSDFCKLKGIIWQGKFNYSHLKFTDMMTENYLISNSNR